MLRYHSKFGLPSQINSIGGAYELIWTNHANAEWANDKLQQGFIKPNTIDINKDDIFEAYIDSDRLIKFAIRKPFGSAGLDLSMVLGTIADKPHKLVIVTCWFNHKTDIHEILRPELYAKV